MSSFLEYNSSVCTNYDKFRNAAGAEHFVGAILTRMKKPLDEVKLLDAGCGTGNYAKALLDHGVGHVTLLDASDAMLDCATRKCGINIAPVKHVMPELPFSDQIFDCVMFNHVLHHMDSDGERPNMSKAIREAFRVLKPGGLLMVLNVLDYQFEKGFWYAHLIPAATARYCARLPSSQMYADIFTGAGFESPDIVVPVNMLVTPRPLYQDPEGPFQKQWRDGISFWSVVKTEELDTCLEKLKELRSRGELSRYVTENDKDRIQVGQSAFFFAKKPTQ